jgi:hypothetical protein
VQSDGSGCATRQVDSRIAFLLEFVEMKLCGREIHYKGIQRVWASVCDRRTATTRQIS